MIEVWKEVKGYEGKYEVSNLGRVRSLFDNNGKRRHESRILKPCKDRDGYLQVCLCKNGKGTCKTVHRLVATAFIPNPLNLPQINHRDEDKKNNFIFLDENGNVVLEKSNLEWITQKDNCNYGTRNDRGAKTRSKVMIGKLVNHPALSKKVLQYDLEGDLVQEWLSAHEIERRTGWFSTSICACCLGRQKTAYGFLWRYAAE